MVLLDNHLDAFLDLGQYGVDVASEFGFCNADRRHVFDDSVSHLSDACRAWKNRHTTIATAAAGTASGIPRNPNIVPPASASRNTTIGRSRTRFPHDARRQHEAFDALRQHVDAEHSGNVPRIAASQPGQAQGRPASSSADPAQMYIKSKADR